MCFINLNFWRQIPYFELDVEQDAKRKLLLIRKETK